MANTAFHHALFVDTDLCTGCSHCMRVCPTEAIRVRGGKARIDSELCIDCGNCYRVCPAQAIQVEQDDLERLVDFSVKIALVPSVFIGQFPDEHQTASIYSAIYSLGFDVVLEVENGVEVLLENLRRYVWTHRETKPLISSYCPAVIRLIQVRFPSLTSHIVRLQTPQDIMAAYCKKHYSDLGHTPEQIGVFYITPCAAKIAAVKSPVGESSSLLDGVINMDFLYNKVLRALHEGGGRYQDVDLASPSKEGILWSLTRGEVAHMAGRALAIDGIRAVSDFLEKVEMNHAGVIDFLELRACREGCASGILTPGNPFLTVERLKLRAESQGRHCSLLPNPVHAYREYLSERLVTDRIEPRPVFQLDQSISGALKKMEDIRRLQEELPGIDCGGCGAPGCHALAEDIVRGRAGILQCPYKALEQMNNNQISPSRALQVQEEVWGKRVRHDDGPAPNN